MSDIKEMERTEINELLHKVGYGHLSFIHEGKPSIMSIHYYLQDPDIYLFTTQGTKSHDLNANPDVCLQVEDVKDARNWRSALVTGRVECLTIEPDVDSAINFINQHQPEIATEIDRNWMESWGSGQEIAIYRIEQSQMSGRAIDN